MKTSNLSLVAVLAVFCVFGFVACGGGAGGPPPGGDPLTLSGSITISPSYTVSIGTELTANYTGSEAVSYHWEKDGSVIGGATSNTYTPTSAGIYYATVSASGYISKTSDPVTVGDPSLPTLSGNITINPVGPVPTGTLLTATYTGSEGVTYSWENDGIAIGGATDTTYTPTTAGSYTVIVKATGYNEKVSNAVTVTKVYVLGDTGPGGGKIFYISEPGFTMTDTGETCHYLEAAPANMATNLTWASPESPSSTDIVGTGTAIGTGKKNTALILVKDPNAPAAKACKDYANNGKNDWFLPSRDELGELYNNRSYVGNLSTLYYWSSSQSSDVYYAAFYQRFENGSRYYEAKGYNYAVRAVRAF